MGAALEVLVGPQAKGLSASTVSRLKQVWGQEYRSWSEERLDKDHWVYVWADGVYSGLRAEHTKLCALVVIGVNERGEKRFLSIEDGVGESTQSWREVLLKLKSRGMNVPELAIGDGAMGFWAALEEVYGGTRQQRCWMHKTMNVLNCRTACPSRYRPKPSRQKLILQRSQVRRPSSLLRLSKSFLSQYSLDTLTCTLPAIDSERGDEVRVPKVGELETNIEQYTV